MKKLALSSIITISSLCLAVSLKNETKYPMNVHFIDTSGNVIKFYTFIPTDPYTGNQDFSRAKFKTHFYLNSGQSLTNGDERLISDTVSGKKYHVVIDTNDQNNGIWKDIKNASVGPSDDWQRNNSTYWGAGWPDGGKIIFYDNPRGSFRVSGPSTAYAPKFEDKACYLTLAEDRQMPSNGCGWNG